MRPDPIYHIDKVYYWEGEVVAAFVVKDEDGEAYGWYKTYTKAERRIVELLEDR